jgi:hypothetical protein
MLALVNPCFLKHLHGARLHWSCPFDTREALFYVREGDCAHKGLLSLEWPYRDPQSDEIMASVTRWVTIWQRLTGLGVAPQLER